MAYIDLKNGFDEALQMSGSKIGGKDIIVQEDRSRDEPGRTPGRGSGRAPGRGPGRTPGRAPDRGTTGRFNSGGRGPSKPSMIASAQGFVSSTTLPCFSAL